MNTLEQQQKTQPQATPASSATTISKQNQKVAAMLQIQRSLHSVMNPLQPDTASVQQVIQAPGQAIGHSTRTAMDARLGHNFSSVRLHTDADAARSAAQMDARAYTLGRHVVFGAGEYCPASNEGKRLLAHELVHSAQQGFVQPHVLSSTLNIDDSSSHAEIQAQNLAKRAVYLGPQPADQIGASQSRVVSAVIQRDKKKTAAFKLNESGVGKLIISELKRVTIRGSDPAQPKVNPDEVMALLNLSAKFLIVAEAVEKKYFKDQEKPGMTLRFHENEDTGSHFKHAESLMEIYIPDVSSLAEVTRGIVHEMVHASRDAPQAKIGKKKGSITRQVKAGISDEANTRKTEQEILQQTQGASKTTGTSTDYPKEETVTASFVSGKPRLTYQEYFIFNAARSTLESSLGTNLVSLAKTAASSMLSTTMVDSATIENLKFFQFGKKEIERHQNLKDKPMPEFKGSGSGNTLLEKAEREKHANIRKLSAEFMTFYNALEQVDDGKRTAEGLQYLAVLLLENKMSAAWESKTSADTETRQVHLDLLKGVLGSRLKGIKL